MNFRLCFVLSVLVAPRLPAQNLADVVAKVYKSVVTVMTSSSRPSERSPGQVVTTAGLGSGVFISRREVLTAHHVVGDADTVQVRLTNGIMLTARVTRSAELADLALIEVPDAPPDQVVAPLGNGDSLRIGEQVFVIGAPRGMEYSVSTGIVSAKRSLQAMDDFATVHILQTDAAINQGNSGGPMFNMRGQVVGTVSFILSSSGGSQGLGFAIASNTARELMLDQGVPWLGVSGSFLSPPIAAALNVPAGRGLLVEHVARNSPGARLGLKGGTIQARIAEDSVTIGGDVILSVQGIPVDLTGEAFRSIRKALGELAPGAPLRLKVLRAGREMDLSGPIR